MFAFQSGPMSCPHISQQLTERSPEQENTDYTAKYEFSKSAWILMIRNKFCWQVVIETGWGNSVIYSRTSCTSFTWNHSLSYIFIFTSVSTQASQVFFFVKPFCSLVGKTHGTRLSALSNYIFILDLSPGLIGLGKDNCKTKRETFKFGDFVRLILESLR